MKRALTLATGLAVGYVAGAHAGRERYDQIMRKAHAIGQQPTVVEARENLREHATAATKTVAGKVTDVASGLAHKLQHSDYAEDGDEATPRSTDPAATTQPLDTAPGGGHAL